MKQPRLSPFLLLALLLCAALAHAQVSSGSGTTNFIPKWTGSHSQGNSTIFQSTAGNVGVGTTSPSAKLDVRGNTGISGTLGLRATGTATSTAGFSSHPFDQTASAFNSGTGIAVNQRFRWSVLAVNNNTASPAARLHLQFGTGASTPAPTGFSIDRDGSLIISTNNQASPAGLFVESRNTINSNAGVIAVADGPNGAGVFGEADNGVQAVGVLGVSNDGAGISGSSGSGAGVVGSSDTGFAGFFFGSVHVTGTLTKGAGSFKIDHPLDAANKYLSHSFVESPDMKNVYDGVVVLDAKGGAEVRLPKWFEALNRDFRYQLTAIGAPGPNLHVAQKISGNRFKIGGGKPGMEVSWQVTGIRADVYANAHRIRVEEAKPAAERGHYLYPDLYGAPSDKSIRAKLRPALTRQIDRVTATARK